VIGWLVPSALAIGAVAAVFVVALHFIARSRPMAEPLPTARFVPQRPVRARTRSIALTDALLLLIRVAAVLAIGAAIAAPVFAAANGRVLRVIAVDRSRAVASAPEVRDSVRAIARAGDVLVLFDSAAAVRAASALDSLTLTRARGSLSAALVAASSAAAGLRAPADSIELVLVSPALAEEVDDATTHVAASWPGRIRLVRVNGADTASAAMPRWNVLATRDDAVAAGLSLMAPSDSNAPVRVVRGKPTTADSVWARDSGHVLVHWPAADSGIVGQPRDAIDAIGGVSTATGTMIGRFPRLWVLDGTPIARWADGSVAAVEHATGDGCIRDIGVLLDEASDITLRAPFRRFVGALLAPCGGVRDFTPLDSTRVAALIGRGPLALASAVRDRGRQSSRWSIWLLLFGAALLIVELAVRRTETRAS
jgi:hypothetical protein